MQQLNSQMKESNRIKDEYIGRFLELSITTIYTYRSRLKSRAIAKDSFEDNIKKIATY